jgi:hypothetical protein
MEDNIFNIIIGSMGQAQKNQVDNKKDFVMNVLKNTLSDDVYERYEPLISLIIDLLKDISKNKDILKDLKKANCFCL